jgi:hypothetical protein
VDILLRACAVSNDDAAGEGAAEAGLVAAAALHVASKMEDVNYLSAREIVRCAVSGPAIGAPPGPPTDLTVARLLAAEEKLVNTLRFDLYRETVADHLFPSSSAAAGNGGGNGGGGDAGPLPIVDNMMDLLADLSLLFAPAFAAIPWPVLAHAIRAHAYRCLHRPLPADAAAAAAAAAGKACDAAAMRHAEETLRAAHVRFVADYRASALYELYRSTAFLEVALVMPR